MNKLKRKIEEVYDSVYDWVCDRFERRLRRQAEVIINEKFNIATRYGYLDTVCFNQDYFMWQEAVDSVTSRPINKVILKVLKTLDK